MTVKDNSFIGGGIFLGEALLKLEDIPLSQIDQNLSDLPQIQLPLTKPSCHGMMGRTIFQFDIYSLNVNVKKCKTWYFDDFIFIADSDIMLALDSRAFDRLAKDFLHKEKRKL